MKRRSWLGSRSVSTLRRVQNIFLRHSLSESDHQSKERKVYDFIMRQGRKTDRQKLLRSKVLDGGKMEYDDKLTNLEEQGRIFIQRIEGRIPTNAQIT